MNDRPAGSVRCTPRKRLVSSAIAKTPRCRQTIRATAVVTGPRAYTLPAAELTITDCQDNPVRNVQRLDCGRRCRLGRSHRNCRNADCASGNKLLHGRAFRSHQGRDFLAAQGWCTALRLPAYQHRNETQRQHTHRLAAEQYASKAAAAMGRHND
jgi:hypothetical protein